MCGRAQHNRCQTLMNWFASDLYVLVNLGWPALLRPTPGLCGCKPHSSAAVRHALAQCCRTRKEQDDPHATFAPALNQRSIRLAQARKAKLLNKSLRGSPQSAVGGRTCSMRSPRCSASPERCFHVADARHCTFAPAVNEATESFLTKAGIPATFDERQRYYQDRRAVCPPRSAPDSSLQQLSLSCAVVHVVESQVQCTPGGTRPLATQTRGTVDSTTCIS
jgi:hypothetical protein